MNTITISGDTNPPEPNWPEGGRTVVTGGPPILLGQVPHAVEAFIAERGGADELVTLEWRTAPTGEFEIRVRPIPKGK